MDGKILIICWNSYVNILREAARITGSDVRVISYHALENDPAPWETVGKALKESDAALIYKSNQIRWDEIDDAVRSGSDGRCVMSFGADPMYFSLTNADHSDTITVFEYFRSSGLRNMINMLLFVRSRCLGQQVHADPPFDPPWQGIVHPGTDRVFDSLESYLGWYSADRDGPWVGVIMSRTMWITGGCENVDYRVISDLEDEGVNVIPMFTMSESREDNGQISIIGSIRRFFLRDGRPLVSAVVKLSTSPIGTNNGDADTAPTGA